MPKEVDEKQVWICLEIAAKYREVIACLGSARYELDWCGAESKVNQPAAHK